ncbi:MAG: ABC transporter ATP-binding protein [Sulfolobales archaeon]
MAVLKASGLVKRYRDIVALNDVSLEVPRGSLFGLLGPNGAGKSTFIRISVGLLRQDQGSIEVLGLDPISNHKEILHRVGYVPETPSFPEFMTGEEYLKLVSDLYGLGRGSRERVSEILSIVGLQKASKRKIGSYSKGMVQRLAIAQALLPDPELLILDEPLMSIDPEARIQFRDLFIDLASKGKTILYSSHVLEEVERVSSHIAIMNKGRIVASGSKEELSGLIGGGRVLEIELFRDIPGIEELIKGIDGVLEARSTGNIIKIILRDEDRDRIVRKNISETIQSRGGIIIDMRIKPVTIDEIFLKAVRGS